LPFKDPEKRRAYYLAWKINFKAENGRSHSAVWIRRRIDELRQLFGQCQNCRIVTIYGEFAHIKETPLSKVHRGRGRRRVFFDIMKHPDCYTYFCKGCHGQYDAGLLGIKPKSLLELQFKVGVIVWGAKLYPPPMEVAPVVSPR